MTKWNKMDYQGKRRDQVQFSEVMVVLSVSAILLMIWGYATYRSVLWVLELFR